MLGQQDSQQSSSCTLRRLLPHTWNKSWRMTLLLHQGFLLQLDQETGTGFGIVLMKIPPRHCVANQSAEQILRVAFNILKFKIRMEPKCR